MVYQVRSEIACDDVRKQNETLGTMDSSCLVGFVQSNFTYKHLEKHILLW